MLDSGEHLLAYVAQLISFIGWLKPVAVLLLPLFHVILAVECEQSSNADSRSYKLCSDNILILHGRNERNEQSV